MRAVIQRVKKAEVLVNDQLTGQIGEGLLIFLAVADTDDLADVCYIVDKTTRLRIFNDSQGQMNLSAHDLGKEILVVSQFTLFGDCRKGRRPNFKQSAAEDLARGLYDEIIVRLKESGLKIETGEFKAHMTVSAINDGPVTILLDSQKVF